MSATLVPSPRQASHNLLRLAAAFLVSLLFALHAFAGQATLGWNASSDSRVTGYNVRYGAQSGSYTSAYAVGNTTSATISGLTAGQRYYFVVRARDAAGTESANSNEVSVTMPSAAPVVSITATPTSGTAPLAVAFASSVTGATSYTWNFGDNAISANVQNPSHTYTAAGTYTASLSATGPGGTVVQSKTITVTSASSGSGGSSGTTGQAPEGSILSPSANTTVAPGTRVQFAGSGSSNSLPLTYSWDFGDGRTSSYQNPRHRFYTAGTYFVKLTVRDANGVADPTPATVTLTVGTSTSTGTNPTPPVANADNYTVEEGKTLTVAAPGVLNNDTSSSGNSLSASLATNVSTGTLSLASNGGFTFTPAAGFTGTATFSYKASDGTTTSTAANVAIAVTAAPVTNTGLVAAYGFNEGTGTAVADSSGKGNAGVASNATWTTAGRFGKALRFNGTSSWVTVSDSPSLDLTTGMTLEAWVYPEGSIGGWRNIMMKEQPGSDVYYIETVDGNMVGDVFVSGSTHHIYSDNAIPLNTWTHLAATYDGTNLRIYINGSQATTYQRVAGAIQTSGSPLRIGGNAIWGEYFQGLIDEVRVYNKALTAAQIQSDMATSIK
jgi:PKD repeat protein